MITLDEVGAADAPVVGCKAANLGELRRAGFPVPDGFVVRPSTDLAGLDAALAALGGGPVAVRSSGVDEDRADRSYAGQYVSILNVTGTGAVADAVRECRGSAARAAAYHGGTPGDLAVLVQRMVPADAAGVAFTVNPVTGAAETVVSAVGGLGDRLMSGEVDAQEWTVRDGVAHGTPGAVDAAMVSRVADLAGKVAAHFGAPQDIEWAVAGGELWLLQARPITAVVAQVPMAVTPPEGWATRNRNIDRPWTPLERSVFLPAYSAGARNIFAFTTGVQPSAVEIGGWVYVVVREAPGSESFARAGAGLASGEPAKLVRRWEDEWRAEYTGRVAALRATDLGALDDAGLAAHASDVRRLFDDLHDTYFRLTGAAIAQLGELGVVCEELLGWDATATLRLRGGLRGIHMAATEDIAAITDDAAFAAYLARHGHRTAGFDLTAPTLAERPEILRAMVEQQGAYDFRAARAAIDERVAGATAEARAALTDPHGRERFEKALAGSTESSAVRDEKSYLAVAAWALVRYAALEAGRRLVAAGHLARADDVLYLEWDEIFEGRVGAVARRRGEHAWARAFPGPAAYGTPPAPGGGPRTEDAWHAARIGQWSMAVMGARPPEATGPGLSGVAASPGRWRGTVRVVTGVEDFDRVREGDVLVCPETTAQWAVLFPVIGGLVTDRGSLLSHPAILAREFGVPAVVATGTATTTLRDGDIVDVDGGAGTVVTVDVEA